MGPVFHLRLRAQVLGTDEKGWKRWEVSEEAREIAAEKTCILLCDMWDAHWSRGAMERVNAMAPVMNEVVAAARQRGAKIVHAPSETLGFYANSAARARMLSLPAAEPQLARRMRNPRLPIDDSDGGSDTGEKPWYPAWTRQHRAIAIDEERDWISDDGKEIYSFLRQYGIEMLLIMGVHTNMCVLNRSFGIKQMARWGVTTALVRDLTDTMYNPAMRPYVSHDEGTRLVVEYIEKFWCPTILSTDLSG